MSTIKLSVVELFDAAASDLKGRHAVVIAHMPEALGRLSHIVDVVPLTADTTLSGLQQEFERALSLMPYRRSESGYGWEIDYFMEDRKGNRYRSSVMHVPDKPLAGNPFPETLFDWMSWRARISLGTESRKRQSFTLADTSFLSQRPFLDDGAPRKDRPSEPAPLTAPALAV